MKIAKILMLRSSMIGVGLVVGGLILAVWHFSDYGKKSTDRQSAARETSPDQVPSDKSRKMIPVKDLEPDDIQPPGKEVFDRNFSDTASRLPVSSQPATTTSPPSAATFAISDRDFAGKSSDFSVAGTVDSTTTAAEPGNSAGGGEFVPPPPANLSTVQLRDAAPLKDGDFRTGSVNSNEPLAVKPADAGRPSPANLSAPNNLVEPPLLPSSPVTVNPPINPAGSPAVNSPINGIPPTGNTVGLVPLFDGHDALPQPALTAVTGNSSVALARPGAAQFDGQQTPQLTIEKRAPAEIQVNQLATFEIKVRNVGQVPAHHVRVRDFVPQGTRLERASPAVVPAANGAMDWNLGTLQPGQAATISMQLLPLQEGQIGSVATVDFQAHASVRTICTKPQLIVKQSVPEKVLIGKDITIAITVSNSGSGDATNVVLVEDVPEQLTHVAGRELEYPIGTLRPGETKQLSLKLRASKAGLVRNVLSLRGTGKTYVEDVAQFEVIAPQLEVALEGPKVRYLDRPAKYSVTVANPGTAPANNIELVAYLPKGLKFVETDHHGRYDANHHAVLWSLEELPANVRDSVTVTALPIESGEQRLRLEGRASLGLSDQFDHLVQVESVAQLMFRVTDLSDPIEQGNETTYEIRVTNVGTRAATGIQLAAALSPELQPLSGDGPTAAAIQGQQVFFGPLERLAPRGEAVYKITAKGLQHGDHLIRVQIISNESPTPVTKEESTRVYKDQ